MSTEGSRKILAKEISAAIGLPASTAMKFINVTIDSILEILHSKHKVSIRGFGTFHYKTSPKRPGTDFRTMKRIEITEHPTIKFRPSKLLNKYVNDR